MGYRSDIVIGVHKCVFARHLITPEIPQTLLEEAHHACGDYVYWNIQQWKWYDSYPEIAAIQAWFHAMDEAERPEGVEVLYGAIRVGEDEADTQTWGTPWELDIYLQRSISFPQPA